MNAFEAAEKNGRAAELQKELEELFNRQNQSPENLVTSPKLSYLRLHGRNERGYIAGKSVAERFNYDYSDDEIAGVATRVRDLVAETEEVHVAFNNNYSQDGA